MIKKCLGCGSIMQYENKDEEGYIEEENYNSSNICKRCFRMKHYGEFYFIDKKNDDFISVLKSVSNTKDLVLYVVDLFTIFDCIDNINKYLDNDVILVLTKRDVLPKSINDEKLISYIESINTTKNIISTQIISNENNLGMDILYALIMNLKESNNVYVVGNTNAGKSSLINKLSKNYATTDSELTTSIMPSTTLAQVNVKISSDLTLIDCPGLIDEGSILNFISIKDIKKITPKKEIKPKTFQLSKGKSIVGENFFKLDYVNGNKNNFITYFSNNLLVKQYNIKTKKDIFEKHKRLRIEVNGEEDIVINGLGFIKVMKSGVFELSVLDGVEVITRKTMI